jgi:dihydropteroate synthase
MTVPSTNPKGYKLLMSDDKPMFIKINNLDEARNYLKSIGCDPKGIDIMAPKMITKIILVKDVIMQDAIIIKQDMLSIGGEVAIPRDAFTLKDSKADILIIGTIKQLYELVEKLDRHYTRIKKISKVLSDLLRNTPL